MKSPKISSAGLEAEAGAACVGVGAGAACAGDPSPRRSSKPDEGAACGWALLDMACGIPLPICSIGDVTPDLAPRALGIAEVAVSLVAFCFGNGTDTCCLC